MLKDNNDDQLSLKGITGGLVYFYQRWQELLDNRTLDVYQYKILNSYVAIEELVDVINKSLEGLYTSKENLIDCKDETLSFLNEDDILEKYKKSILNRLKYHLGQGYDFKGKETDESRNTKYFASLNRLKYQLSYAKEEIKKNYLQWILCELKEDIKNNDFLKIEKHMNFLVSQCIHIGWSAKALFGLLRFFNGADSFDIKWKSFEKIVTTGGTLKHDVLISITMEPKGQISHEQALLTLTGLGLEIKNYDEIVSDYKDVKYVSQNFKKEKKYLKLSVEATDIYSAAHIGLGSVTNKINIASFYNLLVAWDLKTPTIIVINLANKYIKAIPAESLYRTYDYIDSSSKIFEDTKKVFLDQSKIKVQNKLKGTFAYTNISRASLFQEEKYMNLWVALESLLRTSLFSNIISNIKETLPPALCIRYIYRIIRNFAEDCIRCGVSLDLTTIKINLNQENKRTLVKEIIAVFSDENLYAELKTKCSINALLSHRCEEIKNLVTDIKFAQKKLENHHKRVSWHIQRLYRIRNEITHAALQRQISLVIYVEQLYDYLAILISEVVTYIVNKNLDSLEEVFIIIKDNYYAFVDLLTKTNYYDPTILSTGVIDIVID